MTKELSKHLQVLLYGEKVGELRFDASRYRFSYDHQAATSIPHPLSLSLPLQAQGKAFASLFLGRGITSLPHYFENLLPEGWLLDVARSIGGSLEDKLDLLWLLCRDTIGAVSFSWETGTRVALDTEKDRDPASWLALNQDAGQSAQQRALYPAVCLCCGGRLPKRGYNFGFHESCSISFFGTETPPSIDVDRRNLQIVARRQLMAGESLTGGQEKFSLKYKLRDKAITVPGFAYVVKPRQVHPEIHDLPVMEHVVMCLASRLGLGVAETAVIKLRDGTDAFITKRFDRSLDGSRLHAEDLAQASGTARGGEGRYHGSMELVARTLDGELVDRTKVGLMKLRLLRSVIFNFVFGNSDAHLKNHSLIWRRNAAGAYRYDLAPFYDLVPCRIYTKDDDDLGLKIGGKSRGLNRASFVEFAQNSLGLSSAVIDEFAASIKDERGRLIETLKNHGISPGQIAKLIDLAGNGLRVLSGASFNHKQNRDKVSSKREHHPSKGRSSDVDDPLRDQKHSTKMAASDLVTVAPSVAEDAMCSSPKCLNPRGRTLLRGRRRALGVCSYCRPEA